MGCGVTSKTRGKKSDHPETEETGTFWRVTLLETNTRLRVCRAFAKSALAATEQVFEQIAARHKMEAPPPTVSDGHNGCAAAMIEVFGQVPDYKGVGPRPKHKAPQEGWQCLKMIKNQSEHRSTAHGPKVVVFGEAEEVLARLGHGSVHLERTHLTMRNFNARITRKGLGVSQKYDMHKLAAAWEDAYYNFCHTVKTLRMPLQTHNQEAPRKRFQPIWHHRTPLMAANLTDNVWSVNELLLALPVFNCKQSSSG